MKGGFKNLSISDLVNNFIASSMKAAEAVNLGEVANKEIRKLFSLRDEIRSRGPDARLMLVPLLDHEDRFVRFYAARHLLAVAPERSRQIIEETAKQGDAVAGDAGMCLYALDRGIFKPE